MKKALSVILSAAVIILSIPSCRVISASADKRIAVFAQDFSTAELGDFRAIKPVNNGAGDTPAEKLRLPLRGEWGIMYNEGYYGSPRLGEPFYPASGTAYLPTLDKNDLSTNPPQIIAKNALTLWRDNNGAEHTVTVREEVGNKYLSLKATTGGIVLALGELSSNTDYVLTFKIKMAAGSNYPAMWITKSVNVENLGNITGSGAKSAKITESAKDYTGTSVASGSWQDATVTFNSGSIDKAHLFILGESAELNIDNIVFSKNIPDPDCLSKGKIVDAAGSVLTDSNDVVDFTYKVNGSDTEIATVGSTVEATAIYDETNPAFRFAGWYKGDELVSTNKSYSFTVETGVSYHPRLRSDNLLTTSGSFENLEVGTSLAWNDGSKYPEGNKWGYNTTAGYFRATKAEDVYGLDGTVYKQTAAGSVRPANECSFTVTDAMAHTGTKSLYYGSSFNVPSLTLNVTKNTDYELSYYILADKAYAEGVADGVKDSVITTTVNVSASSKNSYLKSSLAELTNENLIVSLVENKDLHDTVNWVKVTHSFNSGDFEKLYLSIRPTTQYKNGVGFYLDDFVLYAKAGKSFSKNIGNSIRVGGAENDPAVRFKTCLDADLLNGAKEIGFLAIRSESLKGAELVNDGIYQKDKVKSGIAWLSDGSINKLKDNDDGSFTVNAALYNIGVIGSNNNFDMLGEKYSVRAYYTDNKDYFYGETAECSLFDVVKAVEDAYGEDGSAATQQEKSDYNRLFGAEGWMKSATKDINEQTRMEAYDSWLRLQNNG